MVNERLLKAAEELDLETTTFDYFRFGKIIVAHPVMIFDIPNFDKIAVAYTLDDTEITEDAQEYFIGTLELSKNGLTFEPDIDEAFIELARDCMDDEIITAQTDGAFKSVIFERIFVEMSIEGGTLLPCRVNGYFEYQGKNFAVLEVYKEGTTFEKITSNLLSEGRYIFEVNTEDNSLVEIYDDKEYAEVEAYMNELLDSIK